MSEYSRNADRYVKEERLKMDYHVDYIRTPRDERLVLKNPRYLGRQLVWNTKHRMGIETELWVVDFIRVENQDLSPIKAGILQIQAYRWNENPQNLDPVNLVGTVEIVADEKYRIVSIRNDMR